ncbi:MAG TPA: hypothetical protein VGM56_19585 [Byssovorax sp.]|jgi:hypothetical protein
MRYLYGDSSPFQLQYNVLATIEAFVAAGVRAVRVEREAAARRTESAAARERRELRLVEVSAFHTDVVQAVRGALAHAKSDEAQDFARKVEEHAAELLEEARRAAARAASRDEDADREAAVRERDEARAAVETFLLVGRLPTLEVKITIELAQGENRARAVFYNPLHVVTSFTLDTRRAPAWRKERKVSDFARGLSAPIGLKKSLFKRTTQPEMVELDELVLGGCELANDAAELRLRKRAEAKDAYVVRLRRETSGLVGDVTREGEDEATPLEPSDVAELERLWDLVRRGAGELLLHKERLLGVELDDADLFAGDTTPFFARVVKLFAPLIAEIAKRSPNPAELSLKVEDDAGRREEIYLKKRDLVDKLAALDEIGRAVFAPLVDDAEAREELTSLDISIDTMDDL